MASTLLQERGGLPHVYDLDGTAAANFCDLDVPRFAHVYRGRDDGDFDRILTVAGVDGDDQPIREAGDVANILDNYGEEVLLVYSAEGDYPDVYCPHVANGEACPND